MKKIKTTIIQLFFIFAIFNISVFAQDTLIFSDIDGKIAVEAEHYLSREKSSIRQWYNTTPSTRIPLADEDPNHAETASNKAYLEILPDTRVTHEDPLVVGVSFSNDPGVLGIVSYKVNFSSAGKYYVWVRAYSSGTEDNGIHVGIDGTWPESGQRMQWCDGKNQWYWESKQRTDANHCGEPYKIYLDINEPGIHTISFSMREDGFEFDKWLLTTDKNYRPSGSGPDEFIISSINDNKVVPKEIFLDQNYPNPFNPSTTIRFGLKKSSDINLSIYNLSGELIRNLLNDYLVAGNYNVNWDGKNIHGNQVSSGIYVSSLRTKEAELTNKMVLSK